MPNHIRGMAGVVPLRLTSQVCLINSKKDPGKLVFPKGGVKRGETLQAAALREAFEEAGIRGPVTRVLPVVDGCQWFLLDVEDVAERWPEDRQRQRIWVTVEEALKRTDLKNTTRRLLLELANEAKAKDIA